MDRDTKASLIRRAFMLLLMGGAAAAAITVMKPGSGKKISIGIWLTKENIRQVQGTEGMLTVTNLWDEDNKACKKLREVLVQLKKDKYGDKIQLAEVDVQEQKDLASELGVKDLKKFAGQLDFHCAGKKMGDLIGQSDPKIVEQTIDRILAQLVKRVDKDWRPEVAGMQRGSDQVAAPAPAPVTKATGAPVVPGMQRVRNGQAAGPAPGSAAAQAPGAAAGAGTGVPGLERDHGQQVLPLAPTAPAGKK